jgi:hypothetical protein
VGTQVLVHDGHDWARKCWSHKGMFDPSSVGTLTYIKIIEMSVGSIFATVCVRFAISHRFFCFDEDD